MRCCANCGLCYQDPHKEGYRCMRGLRKPITDLFTLGRVSCDKHTYVELVIDSSKPLKEGL